MNALTLPVARQRAGIVAINSIRRNDHTRCGRIAAGTHTEQKSDLYRASIAVTQMDVAIIMRLMQSIFRSLCYVYCCRPVSRIYHSM